MSWDMYVVCFMDDVMVLADRDDLGVAVSNL